MLNVSNLCGVVILTVMRTKKSHRPFFEGMLRLLSELSLTPALRFQPVVILLGLFAVGRASRPSNSFAARRAEVNEVDTGFFIFAD